MNKFFFFLRNIGFKNVVLVVLLCITSLFAPITIFNLNGISAYVFAAQQISMTTNADVISQVHESSNFLYANEFYIGYYFNYLYTTPYIETYFVDTTDDDSILFFSGNTGMSSVQYLVPNIIGLEVKIGQAFGAQWDDDECFVSESYFNKYFGKIDNYNEQIINVKDKDMKIIGIVSDQSLIDQSNIYGPDLIMVSYNFAMHNINTYSVDILFKNSDFVGNERFLKFYFAMYKDSVNNEKMFLNRYSDSCLSIKQHYDSNFLFPLLIFIVSFSLLCVFISKNKAVLKTIPIIMFALVYTFLLMLNKLIFNCVFSWFGFLLYTPLINSSAVLILLCALLLLLYFNRKVKNRAFVYYYLNIK